MFKLNGLAIDSTATLDLGDNAMIVHYVPAQEATEKSLFNSLLTSGYAGGAWNGPGIDSSAAANDPSHNTALGWFDQNDLGVVSVNGDSTDVADGNEIVVKDTVYGDTDLSGKLDSTDSANMSLGQRGGGSGWGFGDFNYDGTTAGSADYQIFNAHLPVSLTDPQYTPSLQIQALPFTAYSYTGWSGDIASFTDVLHGAAPASDYVATVDWNDGTITDAQVTRDSGDSTLRVNIDLPAAPPSSVFTVHVAYDPAGPDHYIGAASSASAVVTLNQLPTDAMCSPNAAYSLFGNSGNMTVNVTAGTIAFNTNLADDGNYWQNATIDVSGSGHLIFNSPQTLSSLGIFDNATVTVSQGNHAVAGNLLQLNSLSVNPPATLDLGDNSMVLYYAPSIESEAVAMVQSLLASGYNGGAWNGTGIVSSAAANDAAHLTSLGWVDNNLANYSSFAGISLPDFNQILVRYTLAGDADLSGVIDGSDLSQTFSGESGQGTGWIFGDFNYNGTAGDPGDFAIVGQDPGNSIGDAQYAPAFNLQPLPIQPGWETSFSGDIATFTDTINTRLPASDYVAQVYWGDGSLSIAQVTATDTPGSFRINAQSPIFSTSNPIMLVTLQYADGSGYRSEAALAGEPIDVLQLPPGVNASADAAYGLSGAPGNVTLTLTAGSLTFDTNVSQNDGNSWQSLNFTLSGSAHAYFNSPEDFNALDVKDSAIVSLSRGGADGNRLNVQSLSIDPNATLDLSDNGLIDWYLLQNEPAPGTTAEAAAVSQMNNWLKSGYAGGLWTGPGIDSSVAADDATKATGVGWMDNGYGYAAVGFDPSYSSFLGVNLRVRNQLLVRFAYYGDANLDGQVDNIDDSLMSVGAHNYGSGWVYGDFNYDGVTDMADVDAWDANYGLSTTTGNFAPAFQPAGLLINPVEGVPFSGDIATFTDTLNYQNTDPSIYEAQVDWGDGHFVAAQVTATSTPGSFRINAISPALTDPNAVMTVTIQYADMNNPSPTYQGRPAAVSEPITLTPAVNNLVATSISTNEIDLTWMLNAPNAAAIEVDRSTDGTSWQTLTNTLPGTATSYSDATGLSDATHYYYRVTAIWSAGPSAFVNSTDAWTLPIAPSALSASSPGPNEVDLSWTNNSAVATQFQIERSDDGANFYTLDTTTGTSYADTFADDGSTYWYRVEALNDNGELSAASDAASSSTALAPPSELTATAVSASEIDLAWSDDSVTATGYEVDRSTDGVNFTPLAPSLTGDTSSYSDTGLAAGSHFYYRVISLAGAQASAPSNVADDTTTPPAPGSASATTTPSSVTLNWTPAQGASGYEVDRSVNGSFVDVGDVADGSATTFTDTGLLANTGFSYQIIAQNNAGQSSPTPVSATTSVEVPAYPTGLQAIALSPTSVELIWTNNADNEQNFRIDYADDAFGQTWSTMTTVPAGTTSYIDNSILTGQRYRYYRLFAQNGSSWNPNLYEKVEAVIPTPSNALLTQPLAPSDLNVTPGPSGISLTWTASPSASVTSYWVERQAPGGNWGVIDRTPWTSATVDKPGLLGVSYNYRIVAVNALMASEPCAPVPSQLPFNPPVAPNPTDPWGVYVWNAGYKATIFWTPPKPDVNAPVDGFHIYLDWGQGYPTMPSLTATGADAHEITVDASAANPQFQFYITSFHTTAGVTVESSPFSPDNNVIVTKNDTVYPDKITSASVDVNNNNHINITTSGTVNNVAYSDDDGKDFLGIEDASKLSINPGATIWICNAFGDPGDLTQVQGPPLPVVSNLASAFGPPDYTGNTAESLTWGGMVSGAESEIDYMFNDSGNWTEASSSSGAGWQQGYALLSTAYPEEGGKYTYQVRQYVNTATVPITGYSNFVQIDMGVYPFAPPYNTLTNVPLSPTSAQLLWPEASEGETDQLLQWSTDDFTTIAGSATVALDATGYTLTGLTPNTHYSVRLAERKTGAPDSLWSTGDVYTPAIPAISITALQNAAELGPDDHPQDGYFEITRTGLPVDSLTVSVDLSGTAALGTQYVTDAGDASPVQVTFAPGAVAAMLEVEPSQGAPGDAGGTVIATVEPEAGIIIANGSATLNIAGMPSLNFIAHRTGVKQGQVVDPSEYSNPADFVILTNNNYDDGLPDQPDDQNANALPSQDPDLARFTIPQIQPALNQISLTLSDPTAVRLIRADGHVFYMNKDASDPTYDPNFNSVDVLSSTRGDGKYLARAFDGSLDFWIEGLSTSADFTITLSASIDGGQTLWSQTVHMNIASVSTAATSLLLLNGASGPAPGDSIPESAKFRSYLDGFDGDPPLVTVSQDGGTGAGQTVGLIATSDPNEIGFDVYYPPSGAASVEPTQEAVALNIADNSLFSADLVTAKDEFARQIDGASRSFYQYAYVYDGFDPTPPDPMVDGGSTSTSTTQTETPAASPADDPATDVSGLTVEMTDTSKLFAGNTASDGLGKAMLAYYRTMYGAPGQLLLYGFLNAQTSSDSGQPVTADSKITLEPFGWVHSKFSSSSVSKTPVYVDWPSYIYHYDIVINSKLAPADAAAEMFADLLKKMSDPYITHAIQNAVYDAIPGSNNPNGLWSAYSSLVKSYLKLVATTAQNWAKMYYSGIALVGEGANIVVTINDLTQGNISSLVNLLPLAGQAMAATSKGSAALFQMQMYGGQIMEDLDAAACKILGGGGCFTAGTIVQTENGPEPIEQLQAGDLVWAFDMQSDSWEFDPVQAAFSKSYDGTIITATVDGQSISMTADHPVYVLSGYDLSSRPIAVGTDGDPQTEPGRWVDAGDLQVGDVLQAETGGSVVVSALSLAYQSTQVYSLTVDSAHNFAVGSDGVLVHNGCTQQEFQEVQQNWQEWFPITQIKNGDGTITWRAGDTTLINAGNAFANGGSLTAELGSGGRVTVQFTAQGFPDFTPFLYSGTGGDNTVEIIYSGNRSVDFDRAYKAGNFTTPPKGFTWHHNEKLGVMQLVRTDVHQAIKHTGGFAIFKAGMRRLYTEAGEPIPKQYL